MLAIQEPPLAASCIVRSATVADARALHALIGAHQAEGHLLPRHLDELRRRAPQFVVSDADGALVACAELVPLSSRVAEIRSLVVAPGQRGAGLAGRLVSEIRSRAAAAGFDTLCAFTHDPRLLGRLGFEVVAHDQLPEKIASDCRTCPLFRRCGQYAMALPLAGFVPCEVPDASLEQVAAAVA